MMEITKIDMKRLFKKLVGHAYTYKPGDYRMKWGQFCWHPNPRKWKLAFQFYNHGSDEDEWNLQFCPLFFSAYIILSEQNKKCLDDDGWSYGFYMYDWTDLVMEWGKKRFRWMIPFVSYDWAFTEVMDINKNIVYRDVPGTGNFDERHKLENECKVDFPYSYTPKWGEVQNTTAKVNISRRCWKRKWCKFFPLIRTSIEVTFDPSIGDDNDGWKGGCVSCSWDLKEGETAEQSLRRMEKERRFER